MGAAVGFYIRKSISAGPFRFNLSGSGIGMSVGVKGFRVGTGPRGNYVHMGRGGLYYRASLGKNAYRSVPRRSSPYSVPVPPTSTAENLIPIEIGNVLEMEPANGSDIINQINEKLALLRLWPWILGLGAMFTFYLINQPAFVPLGEFAAFATLIATLFCARWDQTRKAVVIMYDLADDVAERFKTFTEEFEKVSSANRIWNIDTAGRTSDWKRNAGASRLISRKTASFRFDAPKNIHTNISVPAIIGGRQNIHFFPDIVLILEGNRAGALSYEQFQVIWNTTVFIEEEGVPSDSQVVGYTWRFVNKNGSPDRRFNNNRQIPKVYYQQMGLQGDGGLQKIIQLSKVADRSGFDTSIAALRGFIKELKLLALNAPQSLTESSPSTSVNDTEPEAHEARSWLDIFWGSANRQALTVSVVLLLGFLIVGLLSDPFAAAPLNIEPIAPAVAARPKPAVVKPSFDCTAVSSHVLKLICATPELAQMDQNLAHVYSKALSSVRSDRLLKQGEHRWIRRRNQSPAKVSVLKSLYAQRITFLESLVH